MTVTPSLTALEAARRIAEGELTSEELVREYLDRIDARESVVHAWAHLEPDLALAEARTRDAQTPQSPLHGVPIGIKDTYDTADLPTECGSRIYAGRRPRRDAASVARLRDAGAVILGKTVTTELAARIPGPTANPLDPSRTPGGSSSGSAAAVADNMVPLALGSQTVASTIRPAAYCGVWALKPTLGFLDVRGVRPGSPWLDTLGLFATEPEDLRALTSVLADKSLAARTQLDVPPRIALVRTPWWDQVDPPGRQAIEDAGERAAQGGATVEELELPLLEAVLEAQVTITEFDRGRLCAHEYEEHADMLSDHLRRAIPAGQEIHFDAYRRAVRFAEEAKVQIGEIFADWDALLTPAASGEAPTGLDWTGDPLFCRCWTLLGAPAVAVPGLRGPSDMPIGVQMIGRRYGEAKLLDVATWVSRCLS